MSSRQLPTWIGGSLSYFRMIVKVFIGKAFVWFLPEKARRVEGNLHRYRGTLIEKVLKAGLFGDACIRRDDRRLMHYHQRHWLSPNVQTYYGGSERRFREWFLERHVVLIDVLEDYLLRSAIRYEHFVEIGCGSGLATRYMAERFSHWKDCIGLDLSVSQIEENNRVNRDPRVRFVAENASEWVAEEAKPGTVYLTSGGVLEYFSRGELEALLNYITAHLKPSLFLCIEPVAPSHDMKKDPGSKPHGTEMTFSHNYPVIYSEAGFKIEHCGEQVVEGVRWLLLLTSAC